MDSQRSTMVALTAAACLVIAATATATAAPMMSDWGTAQKISEVDGNSPELNSTTRDGCPVLSPDGRSLFLASTRDGGYGGLDIWVATRASTDKPFGAPQNLGDKVNSTADDLCPTPLRGGRLLFVSRRTIDGVTCGMADIYLTRLNPKHGWEKPQHLACGPDGPNSELDELGPSLIEVGDGAQLFFSSSAMAVPEVPDSGDIFVSQRGADGQFGPAAAVSELNATCWVAECQTCAQPMVVWRSHGVDPSDADRAHMLQALRAVADDLAEGAEYRVDARCRTIPDHWHAHARGLPLPDDPDAEPIVKLGLELARAGRPAGSEHGWRYWSLGRAQGLLQSPWHVKKARESALTSPMVQHRQAARLTPAWHGPHAVARCFASVPCEVPPDEDCSCGLAFFATLEDAARLYEAARPTAAPQSVIRTRFGSDDTAWGLVRTTGARVVPDHMTRRSTYLASELTLEAILLPRSLRAQQAPLRRRYGVPVSVVSGTGTDAESYLDLAASLKLPDVRR